MARTVISAIGSTIPSFIDNVNAALLSLTSHQILTAELICHDQLRLSGLELEYVFDYDDGGAALTDPFILNLFTNKAMSDAAALATTFINGTADYTTPSKACIVNPPRLIPLNIVSVFSNADSGTAGSNWLAG